MVATIAIEKGITRILVLREDMPIGYQPTKALAETGCVVVFGSNIFARMFSENK